MNGTLAFVLGFASYGLLRGTQWTSLLTSIHAGTRPAAVTPASAPATCPVMGKKLSSTYLEELSERVLHFWFGKLTPTSPAPTAEDRKRWFMANPAFDEEIRREFGADVERALTGHYTAAMIAGTARTRLALIIMLDQFTRNIYRGTTKMYAGDEEAFRIAITALETYHDDRVLHPIELCFLLLPLQHSENLTVQERMMKEIQKMVQHMDVAPDMSAWFIIYQKFSQDHLDVIRQFGRFPSRNSILGRTSTSAEVEFLKTHKGW